MSIAAAKHTMSTQSQAAVNDGLLHNAMRGPNGTHHLHCGPAVVAAREGATAAAAQDGGQSRQAGCGAGKGSPKRQQHKLTGRENRRNVSHKRLTAAAGEGGGYFILSTTHQFEHVEGVDVDDLDSMQRRKLVDCCTATASFI